MPTPEHHHYSGVSCAHRGSTCTSDRCQWAIDAGILPLHGECDDPEPEPMTSQWLDRASLVESDPDLTAWADRASLIECDPTLAAWADRVEEMVREGTDHEGEDVDEVLARYRT